MLSWRRPLLTCSRHAVSDGGACSISVDGDLAVWGADGHPSESFENKVYSRRSEGNGAPDTRSTPRKSTLLGRMSSKSVPRSMFVFISAQSAGGPVAPVLARSRNTEHGVQGHVARSTGTPMTSLLRPAEFAGPRKSCAGDRREGNEQQQLGLTKRLALFI